MSSSSTESTGPFTASDGRKFAFPVGTAFLLLAGILWWRDHAIPMWITAGLGGVLYIAGAVAPAQLGPIYRAWMRLALLISKVTTPIFMGVVYMLVFTPAGAIMRLVGKRPLVHPVTNGSVWHDATTRARGDLTRQF
ncbi:MAG: SxtJ family membrane protein [Longimicrobiales bacterium]